MDEDKKPTLPTDVKRGIGACVSHALTFASGITEIVIEEGQPIAMMGAAGTKAMHEILSQVPEFVVTKDHIVCYLAGSVEGHPIQADPQKYFDEVLKPTLKARITINKTLEGHGSYRIRYTLCLVSNGRLKLFMRLTPKRIMPLAELGMPPKLLRRLHEAYSGMVLITGPTGSGKTATAMSILGWHNESHDGHILTIEDPIEYRLQRNKCLVTQREVGIDVGSFEEAMHESLRMRPDILFTSEIRSGETLEQAIQGSETGALLVATTHGKAIPGTLRKLMSFTGSNEDSLRRLMGSSLVAVICQALVPAKDGKRYYMVMDVLFGGGKVQEFIEKGDWQGLEKAIQNETLDEGDFISMNTQLKDLVNQGKLDTMAALRATSNIGGLRKKLSIARS